MIPPYKHIKKDDVTEYYKLGAYVRDPIVGVLLDVFSYDMNSLYPMVDIAFNISIDTIVKNVPKELIDYVLSINFSSEEMKAVYRTFKLPNVHPYYIQSTTLGYKEVLQEVIKVLCHLDLSPLTALLKKYNMIMTPNLIFFRKDKMGLTPIAMKSRYKMRLKLSNYKDELVAKVQKLKNKEEQEKLDIVIADLKTSIQALKIKINSGYGAFGNKFYTYFKPELASAITSASQFLMRNLGTWFNEYLNTLVSSSKTIDFIGYGDTDSLYVSLHPLRELYPVDEDLLRFAFSLKDILNKSVIVKSINALNPLFNEDLLIKMEKWSERAFFQKAKKYVLMVKWDDGYTYNPPKIKPIGMNIISASYPEKIKQWAEQAALYYIYEKKDELREFVFKCKQELKTLPIEQICLIKTINKFEKYVYWHGNEFEIRPRCSPMLRGAALYNHLLLKNGLKTAPIKNSDKVYLINLLTYMKDQPTICIKIDDRIPEWVKNNIDYEKTFETFISCLKPFQSVLNWNINFKDSHDKSKVINNLRSMFGVKK